MKQKNLILMVVAVGCGLVAAFLTTQINAKPKLEQVEVYVALKNLPVGTMLTKADLKTLVEKRAMPKDALAPTTVLVEEDLIERRLTRSMHKDEVFTHNTLTKGGVITLPEGMDMASLPLNVSKAVAGFVGPGSKVDVLATLRLGTRLEAFPLLVDMLVLAVDTHVSYETATGKSGTSTGVFPNMSSVSFAVTQEQALLLTLAQARGCNLSLLLRHPGKKLDEDYDIKKIKKLLEDEKNPARLVVTSDDPETDPDNSTPKGGTTDEPKIETVKVWIATVDIPANTDLTKDLIVEKFKQVELPKEYADGAYNDLTPLIDQVTLKNGLAKNQWITESLVGRPNLKISPIEVWSPPKPDYQATEDPARPLSPARRPTHDVAVHGTSGTQIFRYEEVKPGDWKLAGRLSPAQAAANQPPEPDAQPDPEPTTSNDPKKLD